MKIPHPSCPMYVEPPVGRRKTERSLCDGVDDIESQLFVLRKIVHRLRCGLGIAEDYVGRQFVVRFGCAQLPHKDDPLAIIVPIEGVSDFLSGKAWTGHAGSLWGAALEFFVQVDVRNVAHQGIVTLPDRSIDAVDVILFDGSRRTGSVVRDEARLAFGSFFAGTVPSLMFHRVYSIFGIELRKELHKRFVDLSSGFGDISNHVDIA